MTQKKIHSFYEAIANLLGGMIISVFLLVVVVPIFWPAYPFTLTHATGVTILFTGASFIRSYAIRRLFNWFTVVNKSLSQSMNLGKVMRKRRIKK